MKSYITRQLARRLGYHVPLGVDMILVDKADAVNRAQTELKTPEEPRTIQESVERIARALVKTQEGRF